MTDNLSEAVRCLSAAFPLYSFVLSAFFLPPPSLAAALSDLMFMYLTMWRSSSELLCQRSLPHLFSPLSALLVFPLQRHWDMNNIRKKQIALLTLRQTGCSTCC